MTLFLQIILLGSMKNYPLTGFSKPYIYLRHVDDTFTCFCSHNEALSFFQWLNYLHPSLTFTMDEEKNNQLQFLDVLVE